MKFQVSMKKDFYEKLKEKAKENGMSISEYIRYALIKLWEE